MMFSQWQQYLLNVLRLHFAPWKFLTLSLVSNVFGVILAVLVVVYWRWGVDGLLGIQAVVALAVLPFALWMVRKDLTIKIELAWARELVSFGYPFIFAGFAYWLFGSMDRWMLAAMASVEEVGIFSVAFRFATVVLFVSAAFGQAWSPVAIKIYADNPDGYRSIYAQVLLLLLYVMLIVGGGIALFSGELIGLIMPNEYTSSALPLAILCFGIVLQTTQQVTAVGISLEKKTFIFARLAWLTALINLVLNWLLIPHYGAAGAAWATTISYLVLTGSYMYYTQRLHPLPIPWKKLSWILFLGVLVCMVAVFFNKTLFSWDTVVYKLLFAILCAGLGWMVLPIRRLNFGQNK
jgi:O-antigen/teichoic acid export membrane protein